MTPAEAVAALHKATGQALSTRIADLWDGLTDQQRTTIAEQTTEDGMRNLLDCYEHAAELARAGRREVTVYLTTTQVDRWRVTVEVDDPRQAAAEALRVLNEDSWDRAENLSVDEWHVDHVNVDGLDGVLFCTYCGAPLTEVTGDGPQGLRRWVGDDGAATCDPDLGDQATLHSPTPE